MPYPSNPNINALQHAPLFPCAMPARRLVLAPMQKSAATEFVYGLNPAFEVLRAKRRSILMAFVNQHASQSQRFTKLCGLLKGMDIPIEPTDKGRLHQLCGSSEHQNVVLKCSRYPYVSSSSLFAARKPILLLDNVEDPHNVGAILRSADIFGFHQILLPTKGVPDVYPSVVKVSAGAAEFLHIARDANIPNYTQSALNAGYHIAALDMKGSTPLHAFSLPSTQPLLLVIGGEDKGVHQFVLNNAHSILAIEQFGHVNSLNASVAAAIALHHLRHPAAASA